MQESTPGIEHIGRKIVRIRELKGMKQETLAAKLGVSQQTISRIEQSETIDEDRLIAIAEALEVTPDTIKNFNEYAVINNNVYDQNNTVINYQFNPIEKIVELYERLLESERKQIELLQSQIQKQKGNP